MRRSNLMRLPQAAFAAFAMTVLLAGCEPTYKQAQFKEAIKERAKAEFDLDVEVEQVGSTLGIQFKVPSLLSQITAGDESIYRGINGLFLILVRVGLSSDIAPEFLVLDVVDADNPQFRLVFTRYMEDVRKSMAEALSYTDMNSRLLEEFVIGRKRIPFDAEEVDLVRLMMMAMEAQNQNKPGAPIVFELKEVQFKDFLARVAENYTRRLIRNEKKLKDELLLRNVTASFNRTMDNKPEFNVQLDVVSQPKVRVSPEFLQDKVLPQVAKKISEVFKSYRFKDFSTLTVIERNSGRILAVPAP